MATSAASTQSAVAAEAFDVLIVGAGLSGVDAAYRIQTDCPGKSYAVLEARDAIGGTWDLFRYPGIRSDSDMYTLGFPFRPWPGDQAIAGGEAIRDYIADTAAAFGIDRHIRFGVRVLAASWSSADALRKLLGRATSAPPPRVTKSAGTGSGAKAVSVPRWPSRSVSGVAIVHATAARAAPEVIASRSNAGGIISCGCVSGAISARPPTWSG